MGSEMCIRDRFSAPAELTSNRVACLPSARNWPKTRPATVQVDGFRETAMWVEGDSEQLRYFMVAATRWHVLYCYAKINNENSL